MPPRDSTARRADIVRLARTSGLASVDELSTQFGVTASTIWRGLSLLTAKGLIARTYGGAIALERPRNRRFASVRWRASTPSGYLRRQVDQRFRGSAFVTFMLVLSSVAVGALGIYMVLQVFGIEIA